MVKTIFRNICEGDLNGATSRYRREVRQGEFLTLMEFSMITGINHINLSVSNIDRSFSFYHRILGLKPLCKWPDGA